LMAPIDQGRHLLSLGEWHDGMAFLVGHAPACVARQHLANAGGR
jgi:hypothetical protein